MKNFFFAIALITCIVTKAQVVITSNIGNKLNTNTAYTIQVKIVKGNISNFSKYQVDVVNGMSVTESDSKTGNFTFENNRAKIVWVSIPSEPEFVISYILNTGTVSGPVQFLQKFYYLDNGTKKEVEAEPVNVTIGTDAPATLASIENTNTTNSSAPSNTINTIPTPTESVVNNSTTTTNTLTPTTSTTETIANTTVNTNTQSANTIPVKETVAIKETPPVKETTPNKELSVAKTNDTSSGLVFKVQLGAFASVPSKSKFANAGKIEVSNENGMYKVLVGKFASREEALKKRDELSTKGFNGFVASYQNGQRVK